MEVSIPVVEQQNSIMIVILDINAFINHFHSKMILSKVRSNITFRYMTIFSVVSGNISLRIGLLLRKLKYILIKVPTRIHFILDDSSPENFFCQKSVHNHNKIKSNIFINY